MSCRRLLHGRCWPPLVAHTHLLPTHALSSPPLAWPRPQGYQTGGKAGLTLGVLKGMLGLLGRPAVGTLEAGNKLFAACALACLGREGIIGKIQRRVKAPGAFADEEGVEVGGVGCRVWCRVKCRVGSVGVRTCRPFVALHWRRL